MHAHTSFAVDKVLHLHAVVGMVGIGGGQEVELGILLLLLADLVRKLQT
jgi:hypothetical protein